ncbi:hypothetical protein [Chryseobacterium wangxinyae]|nr:hypothetical protein [Chryseobacterium sp. CY353]MCY0970766.1 hypothetical protein [Chryseobacterium sp. CY353]
MQEIKINHRRKANDQENSLLAEVKDKKKAAVNEVFENGDT